MEQAPAQPLARRAQLYRDLSAISGDRSQAQQLVGLADGCEAIERKHQQLQLDFQRASL